jgi:hypothetical protein
MAGKNPTYAQHGTTDPEMGDDLKGKGGKAAGGGGAASGKRKWTTNNMIHSAHAARFTAARFTAAHFTHAQACTHAAFDSWLYCSPRPCYRTLCNQLGNATGP